MSLGSNDRRSQAHGIQHGSRRTKHKPYPTYSLSSDRDILDGLNETPLSILEKPSQNSTEEDIKIRNLQYIGSYNWVNAADGQPTIIVPGKRKDSIIRTTKTMCSNRYIFAGSPREWKGREMPYQCSRDIGAQYVDQHSHRIPSYPLLPLFRAVDFVTENITGEPVDWASVDFVTDRNSLRKLLSWVTDEDGLVNDFRIDMELVGKRTVLLNRWEKRTKEEAHDRSWPTYGLNFLFESTIAARDCAGATGHHRITKYVCRRTSFFLE